jgi:hypothetical protein
MEKQTKILLGLAAAGVVAYLIYKYRPVASTAVVTAVANPIVTDVTPIVNPITTKIDACAKDPHSYECAVQQGIGIIGPRKPIGIGTHIDCGDGTFGTDAVPCGVIHPVNVFVFQSLIKQDLDLTSLTQDSSSPNLNKLVDKDGNKVFREDTGYTKFISDGAGDTIVNYDLNGKYLSSYYDDGIRY